MVQTRKKSFKATRFNKKIHEYIFKKGDICCEKDYSREIIINEIIELYKEINTLLNEKGTTYLDHADNDIVKFIGYLSTLKENKNTTGSSLWITISNRIRKDKKLNEENFIALLNEVPLYYLLAFLGQSYHRRNQWKAIFSSQSKSNSK